MRTALSLLLAVLAGVLAVLSTAGALLDEAAHRPELVRSVTERVASDPAVRAAIPGAVTAAVQEAVPQQVPGPLTQAAEDLVRPVAQAAADSPDLVRGWSDTADAARRAWLLDLDHARGSATPVPGGHVSIPFGPVAQTGVAAGLGDVETRLRNNELNLPGQSILEGLLRIDVGDWAADTVIRPMYDRAAALRDDTALTMDLTLAGTEDLDRRDVARAVAASAHWIWGAVGAGLLLVGAVLAAPRRRRSPAVLAAAATVLLGGWWFATATATQRFTLAAPAGSAPGIATLAREADEAVHPAIAEAIHPYVTVLPIVGAALAALGLIWLAAEVLAARSRRRHARYHGSHVRH